MLNQLKRGPAPKDFVIIGGGASGSMVLIYLAKKVKEEKTDLTNITFHLVDPEGFTKGGIAYGKCSPNHLLNSVRGEMSPWSDAGDGFHQWCRQKGLGDNPYQFNRRADFLTYLQEECDAAVKSLETAGVRFAEHKTTATITPCDETGTFEIISANGEIIAEYVTPSELVVTTGYGPNNNLPALKEKFQGEGYINSVYDGGAIQDFQKRLKNPRIAYAGNGPALYDFVRDIHLDPASVSLFVFSREKRLLDTRCVEKEIHETNYQPNFLDNFKPRSFEEYQRILLNNFNNAVEYGGFTPRRVALDMMRKVGAHMETLDVGLANQCKKSSLLSWLKHTATPVPVESQKRLAAFDPVLVDGRLNESSVFKNKDGSFTIDAGAEKIEVDIILNGTGHGRCNAPLFNSLVENGFASVVPQLGILKTDDAGCKLAESGISCIGPAVHFGTDGIETYAAPAEKVAKDFMRQIEMRARTAFEDNVVTYFVPHFQSA